MMNHKILFCFLSLSMLAGLSKAQTSGYKNEFGFRSENDAYLAMGFDRYYTNGLFITFRHATDQSRLTDKVNKRVWEVEVGQEMYNPISGSISNIDRIDRPFAGYLYVGGNINWLYNTENNLKLGLQAGTIGPSSLAADGQIFLHELVGFYEIKGWDSQVKDEFGLNLKVEYNHFIHRSADETTDFTLTSNVQLGNTFTGAGFGLLFRAGSVNKFFNSASTASTLSNNSKAEAEEQKEFFFYAKPSLYFTIYDATVEGGLFRADKGPITFDVKSAVFSQQVGLMYSKKHWTADLSVVFKSREIKSSAKAHQYGSAAFYYRFN